jgi:hypothetical protein
VDAGKGFGGVEWQFPGGNWGSLPGHVMPPGAKKVTFYAWGAAGNEAVQFHVGNGAAQTDAFQAVKAVTLTTAATPYEIPLTGYVGACQDVRTGFGWFTTSAVKIQLYIDNIQWQ